MVGHGGGVVRTSWGTVAEWLERGRARWRSG